MTDNKVPLAPSSQQDEVAQIPFWQQHRLLLLLVVSISITIVLTVVSMAMYIGSGASQLDLSRPGYYQTVKEQDKIEDIQEYSEGGLLNQDAITEFKELYAEQSNKLSEANAFSGDPLDPSALGLVGD